MEFRHYPVMLGEVIEGLDIKPDGVYVDCTLGGAGHTKEILKHLSGNGRVIGIDRDGDAIANAEKTVNDERLLLYRDNFSNIADAVSPCRASRGTALLRYRSFHPVWQPSRKCL